MNQKNQNMQPLNNFLFLYSIFITLLIILSLYISTVEHNSLKDCINKLNNSEIVESQPIYNITNSFGNFSNAKYINTQDYHKVPNNYTLIQVYEESCSYGFDCVYFKRNFYIKGKYT